MLEASQADLGYAYSSSPGIRLVVDAWPSGCFRSCYCPSPNYLTLALPQHLG